MACPARLGRVTHNRIDSPPKRGGEFIKQAEEQEVKRMNLNVPVDLHNNFKATTAAKGLNMTDVLLEFIEEYVAKNTPKGRRK